MTLPPLYDTETRTPRLLDRPPHSRGPLVGRAAELELITRALEAARRGQGSALFLTGEAGAGCTRLAAEAVAAASNSPETVVASGRASVVGPDVPYRPLVEALLSLARSRPLTDSEDLGDYRGVLTRLLAGARLTVSPLVVGEAFVRLLDVQARHGGVLLVLDDLHHADLSTLAVVEYLLDHITQLPALLLLTARSGPGTAAELATRARQRDSATVLDLAPLGPEDVRLLLAHSRRARPTDVGEEEVRHLMTLSAGIPFVVTELIGRPTRPDSRAPKVPPAVAECVRRLVAELPPPCATLLRTAALFGPRFPAAVLHSALGSKESETAAHLRSAVAAYLIEPDLPEPHWYRFRYALVPVILREDLGPRGRREGALRLAEALSALGDLPAALSARAAELYEEAGEVSQAIRLHREAADRFLAVGPVQQAVLPLVRADRLARQQDAPGVRTAVLEHLLRAAVHTANPGPVTALIAAGELPGESVPAGQRARIHARLAELALLLGRVGAATRHLDTARRLFEADPGEAEAALVDLVAAQVELHRPGPERLRTATELARRAVVAAQRAALPAERCRALLMLGELTREREGPRSRAYLWDAHALAREHRLPVLRAAAELRLASRETQQQDARELWERISTEARRLAAPPLWHEAERALALEEIRRGEFTAAGGRLRKVAADAERRGLGQTLALLRLAEAVRLAHQGLRPQMERALEGLEPGGAAVPGLRPMTYGLARAFCSLLEERPQQAEQELAQALADDAENPSTADFGQHGLMLLLGVLAGRLGSRHLTEASASGSEGSDWNRQFTHLAQAVLLGRMGRPEEANAAAEASLGFAARYPVARSLAVRLVAEEARLNGWGTPVPWLREAEDYFHTAELHTAAGACRARLRALGAPVRQRRGGVEQVPQALRRLGVTVREYEVARLLAQRAANKDIAAALYISPRTVEKHVASLLRKTGHADRAAFAAARDMVAAPAPSHPPLGSGPHTGAVSAPAR